MYPIKTYHIRYHVSGRKDPYIYKCLTQRFDDVMPAVRICVRWKHVTSVQLITLHQFTRRGKPRTVKVQAFK